MNEYGVKLNCHDMTVELVERHGNESVLEFCYRVIGCDIIDIVQPQALKSDYCMVVDDEGLLADAPCFNLFASLIYGMPIHGQPIVGDVVLMKNRRDYDGVSTVWLDEQEASELAASVICSVQSFMAGAKNASGEKVLS